MPTECSADLFGFEPVEGRAVVAAFDGGTITSDAGALLLGATDHAIRMTDRFAACFHDVRRAELIEHEVVTLVGQRVFGIALGYEDLNDHDELRHDPIDGGAGGQARGAARGLRAAGGQVDAQPAGAEQAGADALPQDQSRSGGHQASCSSICSWRRTTRPPKQIILDLDATDDPLHGEQEGRFFHGYYDCYCYLPLYVFCGRHLLAAKLRRADIDAAAGSVEEVARIVAQIRRRWPRARILLRADSGFAREELMAWCEANGVDFLFGLAEERPAHRPDQERA